MTSTKIKQTAEEVLHSLSISLLAEAVAVTLALAAAFVWISIGATRGLG